MNSLMKTQILDLYGPLSLFAEHLCFLLKIKTGHSISVLIFEDLTALWEKINIYYN